MKKDTSKSTILVISMGFLALHLTFSWSWAAPVSLIVGVIGVISPYLSGKIEWVWMKLTLLLGYVVPNILMSLIFFLFITPLSILFRFFNKDSLMLSKEYDSYFINIDKEIDKKSFENPW